MNLFEKSELLCSLCKKKTKINCKIRLLLGIYLSFLHMPQKLSFFYELISYDIECGDVCAKKISEFFNILKFVFWVKGIYIYT
jgi:hypothetical protein